MRQVIEVPTHAREELVDITPQAEGAVRECGVDNGLVSLYVQGATAGIMISSSLP